MDRIGCADHQIEKLGLGIRASECRLQACWRKIVEMVRQLSPLNRPLHQLVHQVRPRIRVSSPTDEEDPR
jgi:hypothetical protein